MPPLVRRYIKTSFVFLALGLLLGGGLIVGEFVLGAYPPSLLITAHVHLLLVGVMLMIVMGVATWMFPRPARRHAIPPRARRHGVLGDDALHRRPGPRRDPGAVLGRADPPDHHHAWWPRSAGRGRAVRPQHVATDRHAGLTWGAPTWPFDSMAAPRGPPYPQALGSPRQRLAPLDNPRSPDMAPPLNARSAVALLGDSGTRSRMTEVISGLRAMA